MLQSARVESPNSAKLLSEIPDAQTLMADLAAAKIDERDERWRRVVLHSLLHSSATMHAVSGVPMANAKRILRHRHIRLTAEAYTDDGVLPIDYSMRSLPMLALAEPVQLVATGTDFAETVQKLGTMGTVGNEHMLASPTRITHNRPPCEHLAHRVTVGSEVKKLG